MAIDPSEFTGKPSAAALSLRLSLGYGHGLDLRNSGDNWSSMKLYSYQGLKFESHTVAITEVKFIRFCRCLLYEIHLVMSNDWVAQGRDLPRRPLFPGSVHHYELAIAWQALLVDPMFSTITGTPRKCQWSFFWLGTVFQQLHTVAVLYGHLLKVVIIEQCMCSCSACMHTRSHTHVILHWSSY